MKKIIALLLVLVMATALFACGESADPELEAFNAAVNATNPTGATITTTFDTALGALTGTYDITYAANGSATIAFSYEKFNEIGAEGVTEIKSPVTGTANIGADGKCDNADFAADNAIVTNFKINLDAGKLSYYKADGNTLTAQIAAENAEAVLGIAGVQSAITLVLKKNDTAITSYTLAYTNDQGTVSTVCEYK